MGAALVILLVGLAALATGVLVGRYYVPDDRNLKRTAKASRAYMRALNHLIARDHDTVIDELRRVVEENVEDSEPYFALGALFRSRGEHERSIRVHQALAVREGASRKLRLRARYELGLDFRAAGMPRRATRAMEDCLVEDPKHVGALRALCGLYEEQGRYAEAAAVWARLARLEGSPAPRREHHLLVAAAQRALAAADLDSAKRFLRDARKIVETPHFFAVAAELAGARHNPRAASARVQQALVAAPDLARFLVPGLVEAERQLAEGRAGDRPPRADAEDAAMDAELDGGTEPTAAPPRRRLPPGGSTALVAPAPGAGTGEPGKVADLDRAAAERAVAALRDVLARAAEHPGRGHVQLAIAELEAVYDPRGGLDSYRALGKAFPDLLPARVAAARLALAADDPAAIRAELVALASAGRRAGLGVRRRVALRSLRPSRRQLLLALRAVPPLGRGPPRRRARGTADPARPVARAPRGATRRARVPAGRGRHRGAARAHLDHGLSDAELERVGARPSVLGRVGGWFSARWSGKRDTSRS